jgi:hypothetical protein
MGERSPVSAGIFLYMVVVNLMKIIGGGHFLQISFHPHLVKISHRVGLAISVNNFRILKSNICELIAKSKPTRHAVVGSTKKLNLLASWTHPLDHSINFIRFSTSFSNFTQYNITIKFCIYFWVSFYSDQTMLFSMIQPMTCFTCYDQSIYLVSFDPN